jgi:hypothetical protein
LRLGVVFSDGSRWRNVDLDFDDEEDEEEPGPRLKFLDCAGGRTSWAVTAWLTPVPPEGALTFVAEWPVFGIEEAHVTLDAYELRRAVERAQDLWPGTSS